MLLNNGLLVVIGIGFAFLVFIHFMLMLVYAIIADCMNWPMPLDDDYLLGKINMIIFLGLMAFSILFLFL